MQSLLTTVQHGINMTCIKIFEMIVIFFCKQHYWSYHMVLYYINVEQLSKNIIIIDKNSLRANSIQSTLIHRSGNGRTQ